MQHIGAHVRRALVRTKETERGELMSYFCQRINVDRVRDGLPPVTMPRMGKLLQKIPTKDLYFLKSVCDSAKHFSKKFWWEINPKNHTEEAKNQQARRSFSKKSA